MPEFAPDVVDRICEMMVDRNVSTAKICRDKLVADAPSLPQLYFWGRADPRIYDKLRAAREAQAEMRWDTLDEEIREMFFEDDGSLKINPQDAKAASAAMRILSENRRFEVSKLVPRIYGNEAPVSRSMFADAMQSGKVQIVQVVEVPAKAEITEPEQDTEEAPRYLGSGKVDA